MPSTLDPESSKGIFALFKGESGAGKSVGALSFPNTYVFDFDKKMPTIAKKHFPGAAIDYDRFEDIFEVAAKIKEFEEYCPYETLIFDSVTSLCNMVINTTAKIRGEETMDMFMRIKNAPKGKQVEMITIDYYNNETRFIQNYWVDALKRLWSKEGNPRNVIIIAHVLVVESAPDLKTKVRTTTRSIVTSGKKVGAYIPTQFDEMYNFTVIQSDLGSDKLKHVCCTEALGDDNAKTAYHLPGIIDFTNGSLYKEITKYATLKSSEPTERRAELNPFA